MKEFVGFLKDICNISDVIRIIPGRIYRQQSSRSSQRINFSYQTISGLKYNLCKGSTAQELFVICKKGTQTKVHQNIYDIISNI